jgi:hypothetical protein
MKLEDFLKLDDRKKMDIIYEFLFIHDDTISIKQMKTFKLFAEYITWIAEVK